jgi:regulator of protease activity HflC (stomatin/prohibitin superfamily)
MKLRLFMIGACAMLATACGTTRIAPGYVGIVVNQSGTDRGVGSYPVTTGRVFYNPFNTSVYEYPTFTQNVVWTKSTTEGAPINEEITFTNKDKMLIAVDVNLSYQLNPVKVPEFYVKFRSDDLTSFTNGYMHNVARDAFNTEGGKYSIDQIMGDNAAFLADVRATLQEQLTPLGVELGQFGVIGAPRPPQAVIDQITASVHATQLTQQKQNELAQVQADANKAVAEAQGKADARLKQADAEAEANKRIAASISPTLIEYMKAQRWNGSLPQVVGGASTIPMVNLK